MAALRSKGQVPVGSAQWVEDERKQITVFRDQETEDFAFSTRNEVEWLNEHMAEIFSSNQLNFTEIFKTPGKLRGKTPRTGRKRNPVETRAPLTDIFSASKVFNNSPIKVATPLIAKLETKIVSNETAFVEYEPIRRYADSNKANFDSGYHGMSEDDVVIEGPQKVVEPIEDIHEAHIREDHMEVDLIDVQDMQTERISAAGVTTEGSFQSAQEIATQGDVTKGNHEDAENIEDIEIVENVNPSPIALERIEAHRPSTEPVIEEPVAIPFEDDKDSLLEEGQESNAVPSPSEGSSPVKALVRKSSLTFASLPAREPLGTKKSIGARVSRTSHLEQAKGAPVARNSYFGRYTGGKSLGSTRHQGPAEEDEETVQMDVDEINKPFPSREESDGDGTMAMLHNKSSTQRLHDRINLLGQQQPTRPTKSIIAPGLTTIQPAYPELPISGQEEISSKSQASPDDIPSKVGVLLVDDDDEWIKPRSQQSELANETQFSKNYSVDTLEKARMKDSATGTVIAMALSHDNMQQQPSRNDVKRSPGPLGRSSRHQRSNSASPIISPIQFSAQQVAGHKNAISISDTILPPVPSTTPAGSPTSKPHHDGPLNASKSKLQSIMRSARGLFTSSAGVSAQAKMETLSPSSLRSRGQPQEAHQILQSRNAAGTSGLRQMMYPNLPNGSQTSIISSPSNQGEVRRTRSSTEKEERRRGKDEKDKHRMEIDLDRAREQERQKAVKFKDQRSISANSTTSTITNAVQAMAQKALQPVRQSPRRLQPRNEQQTITPDVKASTKPEDDTDHLQSMGPPAAPQQKQSSQIQRPKELKRPIKPAKEVVPKPKPQPVAIRVGILSQRIPLTNAALSSSLEDSLPPPQSRQTTISKKKLDIINATETKGTSCCRTQKRTGESDEKEAQRKLDHKREIDRRKAAQQEEAHKREQQQRQDAERQREKDRVAAAEEVKKAAQKQAMEKRKMEQQKRDQQRDPQQTANDLAHALQQEKTQAPATMHRGDMGAARPPSRLNSIQDISRTLNSFPVPNPAKPPPKRFFEPDNDDEPTRVLRAQPGQSFQQNDNKRRRTDEETFEAPTRPTMAPPLRQSNVRKDIPKTSIYSSNYSNTQTTSNNYMTGPSLPRTSAMNQPYQQHPFHNQATRPAHPMAQYTNGKIPFAEAPNPPPQSHKTPLPSKRAMPGYPKSSPLYPNGDNIDLEEIKTDSEEEEDSEDEREKKRNLPDWVLTPNLDERLREQERLNPDVLFGPIAPLVMEDIFKDKSRHHRFRSRTSSANWFGQDKLTEDEVRADNAARDRMRRDGGWTFGL
ncbi:hypothetical protein MMC27_001680 [Xylographa pallens]|nr:hypothetical protein [Xylographa pallens]